MDAMRSQVTNEQVAKDLGISHSMVSRIRSGDRYPSILMMRRIEVVYRWKMSAQAKAHGAPAYAEGFEDILTRHYEVTP